MMVKNRLALAAVIFLLGFAWAVTLRFILVDKDSVHYHANFAVHVDGIRDEFDNFTFYEEVAACSPAYADSPKSRVHMHDNENHIIHVHDNAVTWGSFFENIEYSISKQALQTRTDVYQDGRDGKELRYVLNGKVLPDISNVVIGSEDKLLIDYSDDSESVVLVRYSQVPDDASEYNQKDDPAACSGSGSEGFIDRLKRTIGLD